MVNPRSAAVALLAASVTAGLVLVASVPAGAVDTEFSEKASSWGQAASRLGTAGSLWEPANTAGLARSGRIDVLADNLEFRDAAAVAGDTYAGARYGTRTRNVRIAEKWANTGWSAEPAMSTSMARVGRVRIPIGDPGTRIHVTAQVFANCFPQPTDANPQEIPAGFRCAKADVRRTGGVLIMTARPPSQMTAPGTTSIVIETAGLSYRQLVRIASSLQQVSGAVGDGAGSAQMLAMCRQMADRAMTVQQAQSFAASNGYSARVGSIDGVPQAVTADYRPDRFTLAMVGGAVSGCTYG